MSIKPDTYDLGPQNAKLIVETSRTGGAAKAGHDLTIDVTSWNGTLQLGEPPNGTAVTLHADGSSLRVREGRGGIKKLDEDDKKNIQQTIDDEVLRSTAIDFSSNAVEGSPDSGHLRVSGTLTFAGRTNPLEFDLDIAADGHLTGSATVRQSAWGIKPYSALFGALKVADEVTVTIDAHLGS
ncbi:MAG TPA: YceI family protein [Solirubrobacteraceae bacterium]